jgi:ferredoxin
MLTSEQVKRCAREAGADIVSIGTMDRFEGAPKQMDPRWMMPTAKSIIAMGFRHARGCFRGIEEGTFFTAYSAMGYASINFIEQPQVLHEVGRFLETDGFDVMPIPNNFPWNNINASGWTPPEVTEQPNLKKSQPQSEDRPAPDVFIQLRLAAYAAGLGEIGYSKMFLSPEFGPRQRIAVLLTDAELEPDPVMEPGTLCDKCMACVGACTGKAIPRDKTVKTRIAGKEIEWADIDMRTCGTYFCGGNPAMNPFAVTPEDKDTFSQDVGKAQHHKLKPIYMYARALEGASGCIRACMIHLEKQGKLKNTFNHPFRTKRPWRIPQEDAE